MAVVAREALTGHGAGFAALRCMLAIERSRSAARQESDTLTSSVLMAGAAGHSQAVHLLVTLSRVGPAPPVRIVMPGHGAAFRHSASAAAGHALFHSVASLLVVWSFVCLFACSRAVSADRQSRPRRALHAATGL